MTVKEFLILIDVSFNQEEIIEQLECLPCPLSVCGVKTPSTLNDMSIGQLLELQEVSNVMEIATVPCRVLLNVSEEKVVQEEATIVLGFSMWVAKEVKRINKLFASTSNKPTADEVRAGIGELSFGAFGLLDYYAIRMGITNHEEVEKVPWIRVYKCMDIDAQKIKFQRRLQKIISEKK